MMRPLAVGLLILLVALPVPSVAAADTDRIAVDNTSYVPTDAAPLGAALGRADAAIARGDWIAASRHLQDIVETREDPGDPGAATPWVVRVPGTAVAEGAWIVAHHRILRGGEDALAAYASLYDAPASALLDAGIARRDADRLAEVVERYLPLPQARRAALLLADLAYEDGRVDDALGWLERLEDIEELSGEPPEQLRPWQGARLDRQADLEARRARRDEGRAALEQAAAPDAPARLRYAPLPPELAKPLRPADTWSTSGGSSSRQGLAHAPTHDLEVAWWRSLEGGLADDPEGPTRARPSPWLPASAAVDGRLAFVTDGATLEVWDLPTGRRLAAAPVADRGGRRLPKAWQEDAREELGLLEGFAPTIHREADGSWWIWLAAPDPTAGDWWNYEYVRHDRLEAWRWNGTTLEQAWSAGGRDAAEGLPVGMRLYGTPLHYAGKIWVAAVRGSKASDHEADAWLYAFAPRTGAVHSRTWLGSGAPIRPGKPEEGIPSSPTGACGRVVVSTSLGIVASVDARSGRPAWAYLNDRGVVGTGRPRRLQTSGSTAPRESGFQNRPPIAAWGRIWVAPTDGPYLLCLFDRPRGKERMLRSRERDRRLGYLDFALEQIAGLTRGDAAHAPVLVVVGRGITSEGMPPAPIARGLDPFTLEPIWRAVATTGDGPEPYGTALVGDGAVFVPTRHGLCVLDPATGGDLGTLDAARVPPGHRELMGSDVALAGNVIPAGDTGVLVLSGGHGVFWQNVGR